MTDPAAVLKAIGAGTATFAALAAIGPLLQLHALLRQGLAEAASGGGSPLEILTAMIFVAVLASLPWWFPIEG